MQIKGELLVMFHDLLMSWCIKCGLITKGTLHYLDVYHKQFTSY